MVRFPRRLPLLTALLLSAGCSGCTVRPPAPSPPPENPRFAVPAPELPIPNAARLAEGIYRGGQPDQAGLRALKEAGFKTVVNLRSRHSERKEAEALGLSVVEIPMNAALESDPPTAEEIREFLDVLSDPARRPVFFHCAFGKDRTGTMAAVWRMEKDGWTGDEAMAEMRHFGYHEYYRDLERFVLEYRPGAGVSPNKEE